MAIKETLHTFSSYLHLFQDNHPIGSTLVQPLYFRCKREVVATEQVLFICLQAARIRVPGRSPFSQLILDETDKSNVVKKTKTFIFKGETNERIIKLIQI